jgi:hypothetical protein
MLVQPPTAFMPSGISILKPSPTHRQVILNLHTQTQHNVRPPSPGHALPAYLVAAARTGRGGEEEGDRVGQVTSGAEDALKGRGGGGGGGGSGSGIGCRHGFKCISMVKEIVRD